MPKLIDSIDTIGHAGLATPTTVQEQALELLHATLALQSTQRPKTASKHL